MYIFCINSIHLLIDSSVCNYFINQFNQILYQYHLYHYLGRVKILTTLHPSSNLSASFLLHYRND